MGPQLILPHPCLHQKHPHQSQTLQSLRQTLQSRHHHQEHPQQLLAQMHRGQPEVAQNEACGIEYWTSTKQIQVYSNDMTSSKDKITKDHKTEIDGLTNTWTIRENVILYSLNVSIPRCEVEKKKKKKKRKKKKKLTWSYMARFSSSFKT